mgnify:CR=1 FL=1
MSDIICRAKGKRCLGCKAYKDNKGICEYADGVDSFAKEIPMKYPLEEADFKTEEKPTVFEGGKWYKCIVSNSRYFSRDCYYLCGAGSKLYLITNRGSLIAADRVESEFSGPH